MTRINEPTEVRTYNPFDGQRHTVYIYRQRSGCLVNHLAVTPASLRRIQRLTAHWNGSQTASMYYRYI